MVKFILLPAIIAVIVHQIEGQCFTTKDDKEPKQIGRKSLYGGEQEFSLNLLRDINQLNPEGNIFFSPYSTYHALLLAYFISAGKTEQFLKKALRLDPGLDKIDLKTAYKVDKYLTKGSSLEGDYEFSNANRIYVNTGIKVRDCVSDLFTDEFESIDFGTKPDESRLIINKWVENQTHNMIRDLLPPVPSIRPPIWLWSTPATSRVVGNVSEELGAYVLELPYKGEKISMYILLPPFMKQDGIAKTLAKLTPSTFQKVMQNLTNDYGKTVNLQLPKFSLENTIEMTPILESLGVGNLFTSEADFSFLSDSHLTLGAGVHKAKIVVNEKGSEAAAASALIGVRTMDDETVTYRCNHPFMFLLYSKETSTIAFIGIVRNPEQFLSL
ncbi:serine protease inhibitor serpin [Holotrichia oblita]|uniref:Serine protease inhibitor serpin n=1 Tax=Holotrichia oblita TaxID=644536 RepID=A0ACB9THI9_HOLOL|nr:serine protease inhibitor serpin [Holotrichia oblita]